MKQQRTLAALTLVALLTLVPFLGLTDFNTKGEPREAAVAATMLETGNWILPATDGGEFAYKPPMFHWAVASASLLTGGHVTELSARLPSALATVLTALAIFLFYRRRGEQTAFVAALAFLTCFEVHRSAVNCRVDMVLTFFMVAATMLLHRWTERGLRGVPFAAIAAMGCGVLTKGPVAIVLPCMVGGLWALLRLERGRWTWSQVGAVFLKYALVAVAAMVLPCLWYWAAWKQGGDNFLYLVYEENVLRFLGKMPYHSHEHGLFYYFPILLAGLVPYTLLALMAAVGRRRMKVEGAARQPLRTLPARWWGGMSATDRFSLVAVAVVFAFYCIPSSKRGVYLLPLYPFAAWFVARLVEWTELHKPRTLRAFGHVVAALLCVAVAALVAVQAGWIPESLFAGKHGADTLGMLRALQSPPGGEAAYGGAVAVAVVAYYALHRHLSAAKAYVLYCIVTLFLLLDALLQPAILNCKSDKAVAAEVAEVTGQAPTFQYVDDPDGMLHLFTLDFYLGGRLHPIYTHAGSERFATGRTQLPARGFVVTGERDAATLRDALPELSFTLVRDTGHRSCDVKQKLQIWAFAAR